MEIIEKALNCLKRKNVKVYNDYFFVGGINSKMRTILCVDTRKGKDLGNKSRGYLSFLRRCKNVKVI